MSISAGTWMLDGKVLVFWYPDTFIVSDSYKGQISFNLSTSQISVYSVQVNNSGLYVLQGMTPPVSAELKLSVQGEFPYIHIQKHFTNSFYMLYFENVSEKKGKRKKNVLPYLSDKTTAMSKKKLVKVNRAIKKTFKIAGSEISFKM